MNDWDVRWPAVAPDGRIVFSAGGDLHIYNPAGGKDQKLEVDIPSERQLARVRYPNAEKNATSFAGNGQPNATDGSATNGRWRRSLVIPMPANRPCSTRSQARAVWPKTKFLRRWIQ